MSETVRWMRERTHYCKNIYKTTVAEQRHATRIVLTATEVVTAIGSNQSETGQFFHSSLHSEAVPGKRIEFLDVLSMCMTVSNHHLYSIKPAPLRYTILPSHAGEIGGNHV
jgi:hypothetical protein